MRALVATVAIALLPIAVFADDAQAVRVAAASYAQLRAGIELPLVVEPVVFSDAYALADWTAGRKEGEVLLMRRESGRWRVVAFENNSMADAKFLTARYRVPHDVAVDLVEAILAAEKREGTRP